VIIYLAQVVLNATMTEKTMNVVKNVNLNGFMRNLNE